jgi:hypothetical protein
VYDGDALLELHLDTRHPVWRALPEGPVALLTVVADYVYLPASVNADDAPDPAGGRADQLLRHGAGAGRRRGGR